MAEIHPGAIDSLVQGEHGAPFEILGPHSLGENQVSIRAFRPGARQLSVVIEGTDEILPMHRWRDEGFFELIVPGKWPGLRYHYQAETYDGQQETFHDPYAFQTPLLTDFDLYLLSQGQFRYSYEKFGAHLREVDGVSGVNFVVWAPNAYRVGLIGDFNNWDKRVHPMRVHGSSGVWELFVPDLGEGVHYKFEIRSRVGGYRVEKADPYGFWSELRPRTASIVANLERYTWRDETWMAARGERNSLTEPMAIYEVHLGSWRRKNGHEWLTYRELADDLVNYVKEMGYTHIELMPVAEHPFDGSWGYQVTGYYAPTSRYGTPEDFMYFVDMCHQNDIGVILDWVPAHFPKDGYALSYFDGTHLYEHADIRQGEHPDWGTHIFNYGRNEVRNFLISNAIFWCQKYHVDGLRVDAVSSMLYLDFGRKAGEWIPNRYGGKENLEAIAFMQETNAVLHAECPGVVVIAEESTAWPMVSRPTYLGGLGFTLKWNMGWMHDVLEYMSLDPIFRRWHHNKITFSLMYAFSENFVLSLSHDEVVHLKGSLIQKMAGDWWQKFASLRLLLGYQYTHPGKKLNFMGHEFGQWREWSEARSLDWDLLDMPMHRGMQAWTRAVNQLYRQQPALYEQDFNAAGFQWIEPNDAEQSVFTYIRFASDPKDFLVIGANFTPVPRHGYRIGVPASGYYAEILNSDSVHYGGSNVGNQGGVHTDSTAWHRYHQSLSLTLPPLGMVILKLQPEKADVEPEQASLA
jgi:1,4-alpha-glucan branching enzyme